MDISDPANIDQLRRFLLERRISADAYSKMVAVLLGPAGHSKGRKKKRVSDEDENTDSVLSAS